MATDVLQLAAKYADVPYGSMMTRLAAEDPHRVALVDDGDDGSIELTRADLEARANRLARAYAERGLSQGDVATIALPNGVDLVTACLAVWKLGAIPNPVSHRLPTAELASIIERADPVLVIGVNDTDLPGVTRCRVPGEMPLETYSPEALPEHVAPNERALASGGSTGVPKLILAAKPAIYDEVRASPLFKGRAAVLIPGPLYHGAPFSATFGGLFAGCKVVLMRRFNAERLLALVEAHRVDRVTVVPTMMLRIWRLPSDVRARFDLSSLEFVMTGSAPCPAWLMRAWIEWLGPEVMHEAFGPSERMGGTFITGAEWLAHPGSVGRPTAACEIKILNDEGEELPIGQMGEIYMLPAGGPGSTYRYVGATARQTADGWESVGDMGYLDEEGYLYLGDRRSDMVLCGGRNIYPAEVEAAIDACPGVRSSAVIGLPDDDMGQRLHAIVDVGEQGVADDESIRQHLSQQLVHYKIPSTIEIVTTLLRDDAGKMRRAALRDERLPC
ncbi:MAG: AMP-binding protein [Halioglobus sp.]|nr:AMP-binding protein [Halioglobus sp.]